MQLAEHKVDVALIDRLVGDDAPEEVGVHPQGLVADHQSAGVHHQALDEEKIFNKFCLQKNTRPNIFCSLENLVINFNFLTFTALRPNFRMSSKSRDIP